MSPPLSLSRMKALYRRLSPSWPSTAPDTSVGKELDSIALATGHAADRLDVALDEVFPDTTTELAARWELVTRNPTNTTLDIAIRRDRILAVLRRIAGPRLEQLARVLQGPFDLAIEDITFVEPLRQFIEASCTVEWNGAITTSATSQGISFTQYWAGVVDDFGVSIYVESDSPTGIFTVTSPKGTSVNFGKLANGWYRIGPAATIGQNFKGEQACGTWTVSAVWQFATPSVVSAVRLMMSNDVDSAQIYNFFALRDRGLPGTPDLAEAQRLLSRTAHGHNRALVIESLGCVVGISPCGREPAGSNS